MSPCPGDLELVVVNLLLVFMGAVLWAYKMQWYLEWNNYFNFETFEFGHSEVTFSGFFPLNILSFGFIDSYLYTGIFCY